MVYVLALGLLFTIAVVIWYFFMAPLGGQRYERELEMIRRKLARRESQQGSQSAFTDTDND
jgi:lipopolysaccharide export LptBFGC system permease protein LptF